MTERKRLEAELKRLTAELMAAGDRRDWDLCNKIELEQEVVQKQLMSLIGGRGKYSRPPTQEEARKERVLPDFFESFTEAVTGDTRSKKLTRELTELTRKMVSHFVDLEPKNKAVLHRLLDDNLSSLTITVLTPSDRSGRDLRVVVELSHHDDRGKMERLVSQQFLAKKTVSGK